MARGLLASPAVAKKEAREELRKPDEFVSFFGGITKTLARQLASYGINVNAVAPHAIETDMSAQWSAEKRRSIIDAIPLKRLGKPEDVAAATLFLASEEANFITGEILDVNGGFVMD